MELWRSIWIVVCVKDGLDDLLRGCCLASAFGSVEDDVAHPLSCRILPYTVLRRWVVEHHILEVLRLWDFDGYHIWFL